VRLEEVRNGDQYTGRAESALQAMVIVKGLLDGMERFLSTERLYRLYGAPSRLHGKHQTGSHRFAVQQHGAGAARAHRACHVRSRQPQLVAQKITE
jgi:hypothetical protein